MEHVDAPCVLLARHIGFGKLRYLCRALSFKYCSSSFSLSSDSKTIMKKFEYKIITLSVAHFSKKSFQSEIDENFDRWGEAGWELIKMEPISEGGLFFQGANTKKLLAVFKREKAV